MKLSIHATKQVAKARAAGCSRALSAWDSAEKTKVPFHVLCAYLEQESSGGKNVFGHDPMECGDDIKGKRVTKRRYLQYKDKRPTCGMQGVGPMQLTFHAFQDQADEMGGCWKPSSNIHCAAKILKNLKDENLSWHEVARRYNGSESYADRNDELREKWQVILADSATIEERGPTLPTTDKGKRLSKIHSITGVGLWLRRHGLTPSENAAFGGVDPVHSGTSLHYQKGTKGTFAPDKQGNLALDVNDISVVDTFFFRMRRGPLAFWKPQSEEQALRFAFKKLKATAKKEEWPLDEMFFKDFGFRIESGFVANVPIGGHETHLHCGFQ